MTSDLSRILMDTAAEITRAHVAGKPLGPAQSEGAARLAAHWQTSLPGTWFCNACCAHVAEYLSHCPHCRRNAP